MDIEFLYGCWGAVLSVKINEDDFGFRKIFIFSLLRENDLFCLGAFCASGLGFAEGMTRLTLMI